METNSQKLYLIVEKTMNGEVGTIKSTNDLETAGILQTAILVGSDNMPLEVTKELMDKSQPDWFSKLYSNIATTKTDRITNSDGESVYVFELW